MSNGNILVFPKRLIKALPSFPKNELGLSRGTLITSNHEAVEEQLGIPVGKSIPLCFDGKYVQFQGFTWSIEQLVGEIQAGFWTIQEGSSAALDDVQLQMLEANVGQQMTLEIFWTAFTQMEDRPDGRFRLQAEPSMTTEDVVESAKAHNISLTVHMQTEPAKRTSEGISMEVGSGTVGVLDGSLGMSLTDMMTGDTFFICSAA